MLNNPLHIVSKAPSYSECQIRLIRKRLLFFAMLEYVRYKKTCQTP